MITVQDRREDALAVGFVAMQGRIDLSFDTFCERLKGWTVRAFCDGEKPVGMLMTKDDELHVAVIPEVRGRWLSRRLINEVFAPILTKYGQAKTKVSEDNAKGRDFVTRIRAGFANLTFDPSTALVAAGAQVVGGLLSSDAAQSAADTQANASANSAATQRAMFDKINAQQAPWRQAGQNALGAISTGFSAPTQPSGAGGYQYGGQTFTSTDAIKKLLEADYVRQSGGLDPNQAEVQASIQSALQGATPIGGPVDTPSQMGINPGQFTHTFTADDLKSNLAPNYQFQLDQGLGAVRNAGNLQTGLISGNTLKGINDYAQNFAGNAYQNAFSNYNANQTNIFNRLSNIAGLGQTSNASTAGAGTAAGQGIGAAQVGQGAAQASGIVGSANALTGAGNSALGWYALPQFLNRGGSSPSAPAYTGNFDSNVG